MSSNNVNRAAIYRVIADTLPMEGRDFMLDTVVGGSGESTIRITPITDVGRAFAPVLMSKLNTAEDVGAQAVEGGNVQQERITVAMLKKRIAEEAAEARAARVKEVERDLAAAQEAVADAVKGQKEKAEIAEKRHALYRATETAALVKAASSYIDSARSDIEAAAREAAEKDAEGGTDWAIDGDAPLTTLFDRQDAAGKLNAVESTITELAMLRAKSESAKLRAAGLLKQYVTEKKGE